MKSSLYLILLCHICYSSSEYANHSLMKLKTLCESPNKNTLVEHFFNTVFTEFYTSPPVCVCVQMCAGQSTYCYPNGCLKSTSTTTSPHEERKPKTGPAAPPLMKGNKNHFLLVKDDQDFITDFLEQNYMDEVKELTNSPVNVLHPDVFKNKYTIGKYKKTPTGNLRQNLYDMMKKDFVKTEPVSSNDWTKTRWPLNMQNKRNGPKIFSHMEMPLRKQGTYFAAMLRDNDVPEYPPKYFKRELRKKDDDEDNIKTFNRLEKIFNVTDNKNFSLEMLIDNLIKSTFETNSETTTNVAVVKRNKAQIETETKIKKDVSINSTTVANGSTSVISINSTNEIVEKNKYLDVSPTNKTANISALILHLANQIDIQNNTSMEIAKRTIKGIDEKALEVINNNKTQLNTTSVSIELKFPLTPSTVNMTTETKTKIDAGSDKRNTDIVSTESELETTPVHEITVTRKNRQKVIKKVGRIN